MGRNSGPLQGDMVDIGETEDPKLKKSAALYNLLALHASQYSIDDRIKACMLYAAEGNMAEVARKTQVPREVLKDWQTKDWWPVALRTCQDLKQEELDGMFSKIIDVATEKVLDRIENGDFVIKKMVPKADSQ